MRNAAALQLISVGIGTEPPRATEPERLPAAAVDWEELANSLSRRRARDLPARNLDGEVAATDAQRSASSSGGMRGAAAQQHSRDGADHDSHVPHHASLFRHIDCRTIASASDRRADGGVLSGRSRYRASTPSFAARMDSASRWTCSLRSSGHSQSGCQFVTTADAIAALSTGLLRP